MSVHLASTNVDVNDTPVSDCVDVDAMTPGGGRKRRMVRAGLDSVCVTPPTGHRYRTGGLWFDGARVMAAGPSFTCGRRKNLEISMVRDELGRFVPGTTGNAGGRPRTPDGLRVKLAALSPRAVE